MGKLRNELLENGQHVNASLAEQELCNAICTRWNQIRRALSATPEELSESRKLPRRDELNRSRRKKLKMLMMFQKIVIEDVDDVLEESH